MPVRKSSPADLDQKIEEYPERRDDENGFVDVAVPQYWNSVSYSVRTYGKCKENTWKSFTPNRLWSPNGADVILPEHILMREVLWMLQGHKDSALFHYGDECSQLELCRSATIVSVDKDLVKVILEEFLSYGRMLWNLRSWIKRTPANFAGATIDGRPSLHRIYTESTTDFLQRFEDILAKMHLRLCSDLESGNAYGIMQLRLDLTPCLRDLDFVHEIYLEVMRPTGGDEQCTVFLESVLLAFLLDRFRSIWKINDRSYGVTVWRCLSFVLERHGDLCALSDSQGSWLSVVRLAAGIRASWRHIFGGDWGWPSFGPSCKNFFVTSELEKSMYADLVEFIAEQLEVPREIHSEDPLDKLDRRSSMNDTQFCPPLLRVHFQCLRRYQWS